MNVIQVASLGHYVAQLPYVVGHQLTDDHLVVGFFGTDKRSIVHGAIQCEDGLDMHDVAAYFRRILQNADPANHVLVVGYGPDGSDRAEVLADQLEQALGATATATPVHVHDGIWRSVVEPSGGWSPPFPVPQAPPDMVVRGLRAPAASREELLASVAPLPEPQFGPLDQAKATYLTTVSPTTRADLAITALDHLAKGRIDDPTHQQTLGHLVTTDVVVRDVVLAAALDGQPRHDRIDALVRTYRAAPPEQRPMLATTAAAAAFLAAWHAPLVWGVLRHADPASRLTNIVATAVHGGMNPERARPGLVEAAHEGLKQAEEAWTVSQTTTDRANPATNSRSREVRPGVPSPPSSLSSTGTDAPGL